MQDLLPGRTVVVTENANGPYAGHWRVDCPQLVSSGNEYVSLKRQMIWAIAWKFGYKREESFLGKIRRFLNDHDVQVIMSEYLDFSLGWMVVAKELGMRFFAHAHGYDISERLRDPTWRAAYANLKRADGVITMS